MENANPLWEFSLTFYNRPAVDKTCVGLQDRLGVDVNIMLACCWAGCRGLVLEPGLLRRISEDAEIVHWRRTVIEPLRVIRRQLKQWPAEMVNSLRQQLAQAEISAERIEQERTYQLLRHLLPAAPADASTVYRNLGAYWEVLDLGAPVWEDVQPLLNAAFGDCDVARLEREAVARSSG